MPVSVGRDEDFAANLLPWQYSRAGQLRQEYFVDDSLQAAHITPEQALKTRPPVPQKLNPKRFGYRQEPINIRDVLDTDRFAPEFRSWVSGAPRMRYESEDEHMSAGLRNFNEQSQR